MEDSVDGAGSSGAGVRTAAGGFPPSEEERTGRASNTSRQGPDNHILDMV